MANILVIDDHENLRFMLRLTLEMQGHVVNEAEHGQQGLEQVKGNAFDLIFCDIDMPVLNGVEFVRRYRAEHGPTTPIVMLTAENRDTIGAALAAGATTALTKPFEPMELLDLLEKTMK